MKITVTIGRAVHLNLLSLQNIKIYHQKKKFFLFLNTKITAYNHYYFVSGLN